MVFKPNFTLNKRVFILLLIGLLALDGVISLVISQRFAQPQTQRLPDYDEATVGLWITQIKKSGGYKVVILGDSVIHGHNLDSFETLPCYITRELQERLPEKQIKVFNLGVAGAAPAEVYFLLDALAGAGVDLVLYDINLGWFARENTLDHQSLLKLNGGPAGLDLQSLGIEPEKPTATPAEQWLSKHLFSHWKLYRYRVLLNHWLFGKPIREKVEESKNDPRLLLPFTGDKQPDVIEARTPWWEKNWDGKLDSADGKLGALSLDDTNKQWLFYRMMLNLVDENDIPAVFFITPRNYKLLNRFDMVDGKAYANNLSEVVAATEAIGIPVLDYDRALPNELFSDTVHPLPEGNRILARKIAADLIEKGIIAR